MEEVVHLGLHLLLRHPVGAFDGDHPLHELPIPFDLAQKLALGLAGPEEIDVLGVGYRLKGRFITGIKEDALIVPRFSVLQGVRGEHYVFKVVDGSLVRQAVTVGLRNDLDFEIVDGLNPGERIVAAPDTEMEEGDPIYWNGDGY